MGLTDKIMTLIKKKNPKEWMIILVISGLILLVAFLPAKRSGSVDEDTYFLSGDVVGDSTAVGNGEEAFQLESILEQMEGVGDVEVMMTFETESQLYGEKTGEPGGIVVVCSRECQSETVLLIHDVIQALFPIESHKIKVVKGISSEG